MSDNNIDVVDSSQIHQGYDKPKDCKTSHMYSEGVAGNGSSNVASLIMITLEMIGLLNDEHPGGELNIIFENFQDKTREHY